MVWLRRLSFFERNAESFGSYLLFLATIHLVYWSLGTLGQAVEVDLLFTTVLWVAYYWLFRTWLGVFILWLARKRRLLFGAELRTRIKRSTTLVGRTVLVYGLLHSVAVRILRDGVLFHFARLVLLAGVICVVFVLIRRWRTSIVEAYLKNWPDGHIATLVESTKDRFYNLIVVAAALVYVLVSGAVVFAKQFVLGFEQSRKALAFVFRMRLERKSERLGTWDISLAELPEDLLFAFTLEPLTGPELRVDYFPGFDKWQRDFASWQQNRQKGSFLLRGSRGYGKTSWLLHALEQVKDLPTQFLSLERKDSTAASLFSQLSTALGFEEKNDYESLVAHLVAGERRVVAVDNLQCLFFRRMEGCEALDGIMRLIEATGHQVFWICSVDNLTWRHILAARPTRIHFRAEHRLADWPEEKLREVADVACRAFRRFPPI